MYCNNTFSSFGTICRGVPQGSVLGLTLFLVDINDIVKASEKCKNVLFADDTNLLFAGKSFTCLYNLLSQELVAVTN